LIIGLDGSGKTSLLERIKVTNFANKIDESAHDEKCLVGAVAGAHYLDEETLKRGSRPARLPPPLPPNIAAASRKLVDEFLAEERQAQVSEQQCNNEQSFLLQWIPPPPLCGLDTSESSNGTRGPSDAAKSTLSTSKPQRPPLPVKPGISKPNNYASTPTATPSKRSSFIQLLRCPSPQRYSSAALGEDDEEYHAAIHASALSAICTSAQKKLLEEEWNTNYLQDYFINYSEDEMFDVKKVNGKESKMFPLERIRPTLGQNLAKVDVIGCKCSLFDLSGAEKMRPLWERYYRDTDAIIYVVNSSDGSFENIQQSRNEFKKLCQNEVLKRRLGRGLPMMIFANGLDVAYGEYDKAVKKANEADQKRQVSWNSDEEDAFVGGKQQVSSEKKDDEAEVSNRALDYHDLLKLFGVSSAPTVHHKTDNIDPAQCNGVNSSHSMRTKGNIFLFGGSAKSGEGVKSAVEYLVVQSKQHRISNISQ
jgi:GTPase SAR1 family protein